MRCGGMDNELKIVSEHLQLQTCIAFSTVSKKAEREIHIRTDSEEEAEGKRGNALWWDRQ